MTNRGSGPGVMPSRSWITSTWPSQAASCADADRGDAERLRDLGGQRRGDAFQDQSERAGTLGGLRVLHQPLFVPLDFVAAHLVDALRPQSDVAHHGNAGRNQRGDHLGLLGAALQFHRLAAGLFQDPGGGLDRLVHAGIGGRKRQVHNDQRPFDRPADDFRVVDHLVQGHRQGRLAALDDHRQAVANQNHVHAGLVQQPGRRIVVGRQHGDLAALALHGPETGNGHAFGFAVHAGIVTRRRRTGKRSGVRNGCSRGQTRCG